MGRETGLAQSINKAFAKAVDNAVKEGDKRKGRLSSTEMRKIVTDALITYKEGIIEAMRVNMLLEEMEKNKGEGK
jgi:hypothetical protein